MTVKRGAGLRKELAYIADYHPYPHKRADTGKRASIKRPKLLKKITGVSSNKYKLFTRYKFYRLPPHWTGLELRYPEMRNRQYIHKDSKSRNYYRGYVAVIESSTNGKKWVVYDARPIESTKDFNYYVSIWKKENRNELKRRQSIDKANKLASENRIPRDVLNAFGSRVRDEYWKDNNPYNIGYMTIPDEY